MVLTDFVCDIFMETQISHVKCFKQSLMISIKKKKKWVQFLGQNWGQNYSLFLTLKCYSGDKSKHKSTKLNDFSKK